MGFVANQKELLVTAAVLFPTTALAIALRFIARYRLKARIGFDDWFALASAVVFWGMSISMIINVVHGVLGINPLLLPFDQLEEALKMTFAGTYMMAIVLTLARFSVLFLYHRLFGVYAGFRRILIGTGVMSIAWLFSIIFTNTFRCSPIRGAWDVTIPSRCMNLETIFLVVETINAILDIFLVCLPISKIRNLHLSLSDRIGLSIVFLTGGFVGMTSVLRIVFTYNPTKKGAIVDSIFWLWLQLSTAIICACLPTLRSFLPNRYTFGPMTSAFRRLRSSKVNKSLVDPHQTTNALASNIKNKFSYGRYFNLSKENDDIALTQVSVGSQPERQI